MIRRAPLPVLVVDCPSLATFSHHPCISSLSPCLRAVTSLASLHTSLPGLAILLAWGDRLEQVLPLTLLLPGTMSSITGALARLDSALSSLPSLHTSTVANSLGPAMAKVSSLALQYTGEVQPVVLTSRPKAEVWNCMMSAPLPPGIREPEILKLDFLGEQEGQEDGLEVTRVGDELDLECYLRGWLLPQNRDCSDLRLELAARATGRELLQLDLCWRSLEVGMCPEVVESRQATGVSLVCQAGLCQSMLQGRPAIAVATRALMLGTRELQENRERVAALHSFLTSTASCILVRALEHLYSLSPYTGASLLLQRLATAETLLPLPFSQLTQTHGAGRKIATILREMEKQEVYNPLDHHLGVLEAVRERQARAPTPLVRGRGTPRGRAGMRGARGRVSRGALMPHLL